MAEKQRNNPISAAIWGTVLLFLGTIFILQTTDVLPWTLWGTLWRFWPAILILLGIGILLRGYSTWLVSLVSVVILGGCLGIAIGQHGPIHAGSMESEKLPLGSLERADVYIEFRAGSLDIGSLSSGSPELAELEYDVINGQKTLVSSLQVRGTTAELRLDADHEEFWGDGGVDWRIDLTRNIPLSISIRSAASSVDLDLRRLMLTSLTLDIDAGNYSVILPSSTGFTSVDVDVDIANVEISVPGTVAARIWINGDLSLIDVDRDRFPQDGDYYQSPDYDSAANRVEIVIDSDIGRVEVK